LKQVLRADGSASLQNSLVLAMTMLKHIPDYGNREMIIIYASLGTCDPGDIFSTIDVSTQNNYLYSLKRNSQFSLLCLHLGN